MKFATAKKKLLKIAGKEYCTIEYSQTIGAYNAETNRYGTTSTCRIYMHKGIAGQGSTWREAFEEFERVLNPPKRIRVKKEEAPE